jgi:hypothetical protein
MTRCSFNAGLQRAVHFLPSMSVPMEAKVKALFPMRKAVRLLGVAISGFANTKADPSSQIA